MKSLTGKFSSKRGWALLLILFVGAGLLVAACGDEDVPAPTTPAPPPPAPPPAPEPEPEPEPPAAPTGLRVTEAGNDFIEWSWDAVEGVIGYVVQRSTNEAFTAEDPTFPQTAEQITHRWEGLEIGTDYYIRVQSVAGSVEEPIRSDWSTHVTGMTAQLVAPDAPANLRVTGRGADYIEWTWDEVTGADGYRVQYSLNDEQFTDQDASEELPATQNSYRVGNLSVDMDVYLRVQSFVGTGADRLESSWSTHVTGMTEPPPPMAPDAPTGLMVSETGDNFIEWSWSAVSGADGYEVQFSEDSQFTDDDPSQDVGADLSYRRTGLGYDTRGYLRVRAYTGSGADRLTSEWSGAATGLTREPPPDPAAPAGLSATGGDGMVTWTWRAVQDVDGYQIQYSDNEAFTSSDPMEDLTAEDLSYTRENLEPDTTHYLRVRSFVVANETRFESDWAGPVSGRTDLETLTVPTRLEVDADATDHDSIGWTWDAVSGVEGYEAQFSTSQPFVDTDQILTTSGENSTSVAVHNLEAEANGYLRVRSVVGTGASARRSEWSEASMGTTTVAPDPDPLAAPENFESTAQTETTITLGWDAVDDAETYVVQQREGDADWTGAACGADDGDSEVEDTECVASGLDSGTDYDFRVRAFPANDDDAHTVSDWSDIAETRTGGTAPPEPTTPTSGGMGNLNVQWTGLREAIEWTWDRLAGKTYDYAVISGDDLPRMDAENPCADVSTYTETESADTHADTAESPALLCVKTSNPDNRRENLSFAWAVLRLPAPDLPAATGVSPAADTGMPTKSLTWIGLTVEGGFSYEIKTIADPERQNRVTATVPVGDDLQRACSDGQLLESDETDVVLRGLETTLTRVQPYTGYLLCVRSFNSSGSTDWVVPAANAEHYTAPGQPPRPTKNSTRSLDDRDADAETIVWNVGTRNNSHVPRGVGTFEEHYTVKVITHTDRVDDDGDNLHDDSVTRPKVSTCGDGFTDAPYSTDTAPDVAITSDGFTVTVTADRPTTAVRVGGTEGTPTTAILSNIVSLCIQAKHGEDAVGPWNISSAETIEKQADQN